MSNRYNKKTVEEMKKCSEYAKRIREHIELAIGYSESMKSIVEFSDSLKAQLKFTDSISNIVPEKHIEIYKPWNAETKKMYEEFMTLSESLKPHMEFAKRVREQLLSALELEED